ncbi:MAG: hypothetical protein CVT64_11090 [Actinobacteria bacterium HGW-Actinobacteria-4]|nr:MAG: hypothetical protein CVT64_11090 [Actinobacteria bacterium HGW-Actinobacteria-4]
MTDGGGDVGDGTAMVAGMGAGAGLVMAGGALGAMSKMVPPTPGGLLTTASVREQLEAYKKMQADGLITQDDYDAVKARVLGLDGA